MQQVEQGLDADTDTDATEPEVTLHVEVPMERLLGSLLVSLETAWLVAVFGGID
jgi:hypothetical protein